MHPGGRQQQDSTQGSARDQDPVPGVLDRVRRVLGGLPGDIALALGGSHARGTADEHSDVDVGLYYDPRRRPAPADLREALAELDDRGEPHGFAAYGEWGQWVNGGAWLQVSGRRVDVLLRDLTVVRRVVAECAVGQVEIGYQPGHPHGFCTAIYAAEIRHHVTLLDPLGRLAELRSLTMPYPSALAEALVARFAWESGFALDTAAKAARRGDVAYVSGCAYRAVACLTQVVFATEREYLAHEKGAVALADRFAAAPPGYADRVGAALGRLSAEPRQLEAALRELGGLRADVLAQVQVLA